MRFWIQVDSVSEGRRSRVIDTDDLMGVINGSLSSYTLVMNPDDALTSKVTIMRVEETGE